MFPFTKKPFTIFLISPEWMLWISYFIPSKTKKFKHKMCFISKIDCFLKQIKKELLMKDIKLIERTHRSESQIREGKYVKADTSMSDEMIDDFLMD